MNLIPELANKLANLNLPVMLNDIIGKKFYFVSGVPWGSNEQKIIVYGEITGWMVCRNGELRIFTTIPAIECGGNKNNIPLDYLLYRPKTEEWFFVAHYPNFEYTPILGSTEFHLILDDPSPILGASII